MVDFFYHFNHSSNCVDLYKVHVALYAMMVSLNEFYYKKYFIQMSD